MTKYEWVQGLCSSFEYFKQEASDVIIFTEYLIHKSRYDFEKEQE